MRQRARRDEDKVQRTSTILKAAADIWSKTAWSDFTMTGVAERAGIVKGTVYLYFTTKEELLLAIFQRHLEEYFAQVDGALGKRRGRWSPAHVGGAFANALRGRDSFLRILPILGAVLEHNVGYPAALAFKRATLARFATTAALLEGRVPALRPGHGMRFLLRASALLTGLANMAFPAAVVQKVFHDEPELRVLRVDLHGEFLDGVTALLRGMEKRP